MTNQGSIEQFKPESSHQSLFKSGGVSQEMFDSRQQQRPISIEEGASTAFMQSPAELFEEFLAQV